MGRSANEADLHQAALFRFADRPQRRLRGAKLSLRAGQTPVRTLRGPGSSSSRGRAMTTPNEVRSFTSARCRTAARRGRRGPTLGRCLHRRANYPGRVGFERDTKRPLADAAGWEARRLLADAAARHESPQSTIPQKSQFVQLTARRPRSDGAEIGCRHFGQRRVGNATVSAIGTPAASSCGSSAASSSIGTSNGCRQQGQTTRSPRASSSSSMNLPQTIAGHRWIRGMRQPGISGVDRTVVARPRSVRLGVQIPG